MYMTQQETTKLTLFSGLTHRSVLAISGITLIIISVLVILGWIIKIPFLIQIKPYSAPTSFNTALGLLFLGLTITMLLYDKKQLVRIFSIVPLLIGTLTLAEYIFNINLYIDQLFVKPFLSSGEEFPGRPSIYALVSLIFYAVLYIILTIQKGIKYSAAIVLFGGVIVFAFSSATLFEYLLGIQLPPIKVTNVPVPTAIGFLLNGIVLIYITADKFPLYKRTFTFPLLILIAGLTFTVTTYLTLRQAEKLSLNNRTDVVLHSIKAKIKSAFESHINALERMVKRWELRGRTPEAEWYFDAQLYIDHIKSLIAVCWIDPNFNVQREVAKIQSKELCKIHFSTNTNRKALYDYASIDRDIRAVLLVDKNGKQIIQVVIPIFVKNKFDGLLISWIDPNIFFSEVLIEPIALGYFLNVTFNGNVIYNNYEELDIESTEWQRESMIYQYASASLLKIIPSSELITKSRTTLPTIVFISGSLITILFAFVYFQNQKITAKSNEIGEININLKNEVEERKLKEEQLQKSEAKYSELIEQASDGIMIADNLGNYEVANRKACETLCYSKEEILKLNIKDLISEEEIKIKPLRFDELQAGKTIISERNLKRKDGTFVLCEISSKILSDGRLQDIFRDITERKKAEEIIKKLSNAVEQAADCIYITDKSGNIEYANPTFYKLTGYSKEETIGNTPRILKSGMHTKEFYKDLWQTLLSGKSFIGLFINKRKKGELYYSQNTITPIIDNTGNITNFVCTAKDITEIIKAEEAIRKLNEELEERIKQRTAQLEQINKELEAFSYSVSHDLRAPLRAIDGFAQILYEDHSDKLDANALRNISVIRENAKNMDELIDNLLTFSRLSRQEVHKNSINMNQVAQDVWNTLKQFLPERKINIKIGKLPKGYGDLAMIKQVVTNLLSNSIKFTRPRETAEIEITGSKSKKETLYSIRDNGVGFNMQYADKLFTVFQRLHSDKEFEGTGIGLAIVQRIINKHGGRVWADSKLNEETTFYFSLPNKENSYGT
jgi:PAS domain S-box-containing protein